METLCITICTEVRRMYKKLEIRDLIMIKDRVKGSKHCLNFFADCTFIHRQQHRNFEQSEMCEMFIIVRTLLYVYDGIIQYSIQFSIRCMLLPTYQLTHEFHLIFHSYFCSIFHSIYFDLVTILKNLFILTDKCAIRLHSSFSLFSHFVINNFLFLFPSFLLPRIGDITQLHIVNNRWLGLRFSRRVGRGGGIQNERYSVYVNHIRIFR